MDGDSVGCGSHGTETACSIDKHKLMNIVLHSFRKMVVQDHHCMTLVIASVCSSYPSLHHS